MPERGDGGVVLHVGFVTMSASGGRGEYRDSQYFYTTSAQTAFDMWARNARLETLQEDEAERLWAEYEAASK